jgi:hypothetical protein
MAMADYYLCDKCGEKCFYDANLNYEYPDKAGDQLVKDRGFKLDHLGDIAALCLDCSQTHEVIVQEKTIATQQEKSE